MEVVNESTIKGYLAYIRCKNTKSTVDDMFRLLDSIKDTTLLGLRNRALFKTLYSSGIRVPELTGFNTIDVNFSTKCILVLEKEKRERLVPLR